MKKLVLGLVLVFLGFWLFRDPDSLASAMTSAGGGLWDGTQSLFTAVIDFIVSF